MKVTAADGRDNRLDLVVTNRTAYKPWDATANVLIGADGKPPKFAKINMAGNSNTQLRVSIKPSCCQGVHNCKVCEGEESNFLKKLCYAAGCCCMGDTTYTAGSCDATVVAAKRLSYSCPQMDVSLPPTALPPGALVGMTVYDFDTGPG